MSTPTGEPMLPADYGTREGTIERLIFWDAVAVAGEPRAMAAALKEYIAREMFENGIQGGLLKAYQFFMSAQTMAVLEYTESKVIKESHNV